MECHVVTLLQNASVVSHRKPIKYNEDDGELILKFCKDGNGRWEFDNFSTYGISGFFKFEGSLITKNWGTAMPNFVIAELLNSGWNFNFESLNKGCIY